MGTVSEESHEEEDILIDQYMLDDMKHVQLIFDEHGEEVLELSFKRNEDNKWQIHGLYLPMTFSPSYYFSKVGEHIRLTGVSEHCNMIPPDFEEIDIVGITPTIPNEGFRTYGVRNFETNYVWDRESNGWVPK